MRALIIIYLLLGSAAYAQPMPTTVQETCWLGGEQYSPGSTIRAGNSVMVCTDDFKWQATDQWAAGCLHGGNLYSEGAVENASAQQQILSKCQQDGTWEPTKP